MSLNDTEHSIYGHKQLGAQ